MPVTGSWSMRYAGEAAAEEGETAPLLNKHINNFSKHRCSCGHLDVPATCLESTPIYRARRSTSNQNSSRTLRHLLQDRSSRTSILEFTFHLVCIASFLAIPVGWAGLVWLSSRNPRFVCRNMPFVERALHNVRLGWLGTFAILVWFVLNLVMHWSERTRQWLHNGELQASAQMLLLVVPMAGFMVEQYLFEPGSAFDCKSYVL